MKLFEPPGCYNLWLYTTGWQLVVMAADALFFIAYTAISVQLLALRKQAIRLGMTPWVLHGFAAFIFLCGSYHAVAAARVVWTLYEISIAVTVLGALVSAGVAALFWPLARRLAVVMEEYLRGAETPEELSRRSNLLVAKAELLRDDIRDIKELFERGQKHVG